MAEKVADYERVLKDLSLRASEDDVKLIKTTLDKVGLVAVITSEVLTATGCTIRTRRRLNRDRNSGIY